MKILLISSNSSGAGGGEQYLVYLAERLRMLGDHPVVLLSTHAYMDGWEKKFRSIGVEVLREKLTSLRDRPFRLIQSIQDQRQIKKIGSICDQVGPEIIHVNQQYAADGLDYLMGAMRYGKAKVFGTIHMPMLTTPHPRDPWDPKTWAMNGLMIERFKYIILRRWYSKYRYQKIFVSRSSRQEYDLWIGRDNGTSHVVQNGIPVERFRPSISDPGRCVVAFCGRLASQKQPQLVVDAWMHAVRLMGLSGSELLMIGDGPLRSDLERKLAAATPGSWNITGWVERPEDHLARASVVLFASSFEGFPFAILEASCMGKVCVAAPFTGSDELKEKLPNLIIADSRSVEDIARALMRALERASIAGTSVEEIRRYFSSERMAGETKKLYEAVL